MHLVYDGLSVGGWGGMYTSQNFANFTVCLMVSGTTPPEATKNHQNQSKAKRSKAIKIKIKIQAIGSHQNRSKANQSKVIKSKQNQINQKKSDMG